MKKAVFFIICALAFVSCKIDINLSDEVQLDWDGSSCWMENISDDVLLKDLNIPGTHDTCANYDFLGLSSTAAAQDLTLSEQLLSGVRYLDIRPCLEDGELIIRHGPTKQNITFNEVIDTVNGFLLDNPSETIIMAIYPEYTDSNDYSNSYKVLKNLDNSKFIKGVDASSLKLGSCRGKTVIVGRLSIPSGMEDVFCSGYSETGAKYKTTDIEEQWSVIKKALESHRRDCLIAIYTAGYFEGQFGIPNIRVASSAINPKLKDYLSNQEKTKHLGIITTDHITKNLAHAIYILNK